MRRGLGLFFEVLSRPKKLIPITKVGLQAQVWLNLDPLHLSLGKSIAERAEKYAAWLRKTIPESEIKLIREATQRGQLTAKSMARS